MADWFRRFAHYASAVAGHYATFLAAVLLIVVWAASGPLLDFSETWQLTINTGTTIVTFLMVFVIQNTQNRDTQSMQLKLDEVIRSLQDADNAVMRVEDETDAELAELKRRYETLSHEHATLRSQMGDLRDEHTST